MGTHTTGRRPSLGNRRLGAVQIVFFVVAASGPMVAFAGGISTTYAVTGNIGVPLSFVLIAPVLALFAVGYAAMSRYITNAGAFYPYVANGIGKSAATAISFVSLIAYNAIQIGIYGLFGWTLSDWLHTMFGVVLPWWLCAVAMALVVGVFGALRIDLNARVLGVALVLEIVTIVIIDVVFFSAPAGGTVSFAPLAPSTLFTAGAGGVFAFSVAAFTGFEGAATYGEECRDPSRTVGRATYIAIAVTAVLYAVSSLAMTAATGPSQIVDAATAAGPGLIFGLSQQHLGKAFADIAYILFLTSQSATLLSFHNAVARYLFALGREGVLPASLSRTSRRTGSPLAGSVTQSVLALVVVVGFALARLDPVTQLFTWLSSTSSTGVVLIMLAVSLSVIGFFRTRPGAESAWRRLIAPALAALLLAAILVLIVLNFDVLLGPGTSPWLRWGLPGSLFVVGLIGFLRAELLRTRHPAVYAGIGGQVAGEDDDDDNAERVPLRLREG